MTERVAEIDFADTAELGNDILGRLSGIRESEPVLWNDSLNGWLITRHEDVMSGFRGGLPLSCVRLGPARLGAAVESEFEERYPLSMATVPYWITNLDPPRLTRLRALMNRAFSKSTIEALRPFSRKTIAMVLDSVADRDEVDFVSDVARQITGRMILHKFGLPETYLDRLEYWASASNRGLGAAKPPPDAMEMVEDIIAEMRDIFVREIAKRRAAPGEDFLSQLVLAQDEKSVLSDEDILGICYLNIIAGHDTTLNTMTLGTIALCDNPHARDQLLARPDDALRSVMELMRYIGMSTVFDRIAAADFTLHGQLIRKGERVWLTTASANRDPRVFADPERLDLCRDNVDQMTAFGADIHHCLGHLLAKMQLAEFFPAFFARFPNAKVLDDRFEFQPAIGFRGLDRLRLALR